MTHHLWNGPVNPSPTYGHDNDDAPNNPIIRGEWSAKRTYYRPFIRVQEAPTWDVICPAGNSILELCDIATWEDAIALANFILAVAEDAKAVEENE